MAPAEFRLPRLFVDAPLAPGRETGLGREASHRLLGVLRLAPGDPLLLFNGRDGEWRATLAHADRRAAVLAVGERTRAQPAPQDLHLLFAPLKHARLDYMVQKAVEMGAGRLQPTLTRHTQVARVNLDRMRANVIEAAEQCGVLAVPEVAAEARLADLVAALGTRLLVFCDEEAEVADPLAALAAAERPGAAGPHGAVGPHGAAGPLAVLIGPEGGFAEDERALVRAHPRTLRLSLGPRVLRADTAAVAALALVQAALGDWRG